MEKHSALWRKHECHLAQFGDQRNTAADLAPRLPGRACGVQEWTCAALEVSRVIIGITYAISFWLEEACRRGDGRKSILLPQEFHALTNGLGEYATSLGVDDEAMHLLFEAVSERTDGGAWNRRQSPDVSPELIRAAGRVLGRIQAIAIERCFSTGGGRLHVSDVLNALPPRWKTIYEAASSLPGEFTQDDIIRTAERNETPVGAPDVKEAMPVLVNLGLFSQRSGPRNRAIYSLASSTD